jgi:hypothetical protein
VEHKNNDDMTKSIDKKSVTRGRRQRQVTTKLLHLVLKIILLYCPVVYSYVVQWKSYSQSHRHYHVEFSTEKNSNKILLLAQINPDNDDDNSNSLVKKNDAAKKEENNTDKIDQAVEYYQAEEEATRKRTQRLNFPRAVMTTISKTVQYMAYGFLITSFGLNVMGYSFIKDDSGLRIGTMDELRFQNEIVKSTKERN